MESVTIEFVLFFFIELCFNGICIVKKYCFFYQTPIKFSICIYSRIIFLVRFLNVLICVFFVPLL